MFHQYFNRLAFFAKHHSLAIIGVGLGIGFKELQNPECKLNSKLESNFLRSISTYKDLSSIMILSGNSNLQLAHHVAFFLGTVVDKINPNCSIEEQCSSPKKNAYIIETVTTGKSLMELVELITNTKLKSVKEITVIIPFFRPSNIVNEKPMSWLSVEEKLKDAGADRIVLVEQEELLEKYSEMIIPVDNLLCIDVILPHLLQECLVHPVIMTSNEYGIRQAQIIFHEKGLHASFVKLQQSYDSSFLQDLRGKDVILMESTIASGEQLYETAKLLQKQGVSRVYAIVMHGFCTPEALDKLDSSWIQKIYLLDTVSFTEEEKHPKFNIISVGSFLAEKIKNIQIHDQKHQ